MLITAHNHAYTNSLIELDQNRRSVGEGNDTNPSRAHRYTEVST